jgi:aryl-alcohol dehydrogenase-like predicted oxidoreductase
VLSRGLLAGSRPGARDFRAFLPRFSGDNLAQNQKLIDALHALAKKKNATPSQLAIAWVLARGADIVPVIGARTRAQLEESLGALMIELSDDEQREI